MSTSTFVDVVHENRHYRVIESLPFAIKKSREDSTQTVPAVNLHLVEFYDVYNIYMVHGREGTRPRRERRMAQSSHKSGRNVLVQIPDGAQMHVFGTLKGSATLGFIPNVVRDGRTCQLTILKNGTFGFRYYVIR